MKPEGYIPPSHHTLSNHKLTVLHLCDEYLCTSNILLPSGDNGESLGAAANEEGVIQDVQYKFGALNDQQRPPRHHIPI